MASTPPHRRVGLGLFLLVLAAGVVVALAPAERSARAAPEERVLLDTEVHLRSAGATLAFVVDRPGEVSVFVDLPEDGVTHAELGLPGPVAPPDGGLYRPDPRSADRFRLEGPAEEPYRKRLMTVGTWALHVEPYPVSMGDCGGPVARVRVTYAPR